jgi:hypothetical protein
MTASDNEDRQCPATSLTERHQTEFRRYLVRDLEGSKILWF